MATRKRRKPPAKPPTPEQEAALSFRNRLKQSDEIFTYDCVSDELKGETIDYKAISPGDLLILRESALSIKLTEMGYRTQGVSNEEYADAMGAVPKMDGIEVAVNGARAVVVQSAVKPRFSHSPADKCPDDCVPIEDVPISEVLIFAQEIAKTSGVEDAEDRFRESDGESAVGGDAGESDRPPDDSDTESEADGEG